MEQLRAYKTIAPDGMGESLFEDRKSQFYGFAIHAETADEAIEFRHSVREQIPTASHYVSAWVLRNGAEFYSDAKEPHGTAGLPVLNVIKGHDLADTAVVVARVFGGTLLGKGGLMRAYTKAATEAVEAASIMQRVPSRLLELTVLYPLYEPLKQRLPDWGAFIEDETFAESVTFSLAVPQPQADELVAQVLDFSNGRATCETLGEELRYLPIV